MSGESITVKYCSSQGFGQKFQEFKKQLNEVVPQLKIQGSKIVVDSTKKLTKYAMTGIRYVIIAFFIARMFEVVKTHPLFIQYSPYLNMYALLGVFFVAGLIQGKVESEGAFEVYQNDKLIFSKLEKKRMPEVQEISQIISKKE